jgi:hypothetical protein
MNNGIAVGLSPGNGHDADAAFEYLATNHDLDNLTRPRQVALVKIRPRLVFSAAKANMTYVVGHKTLEKSVNAAGEAASPPRAARCRPIDNVPPSFAFPALGQ